MAISVLLEVQSGDADPSTALSALSFGGAERRLQLDTSFKPVPLVSGGAAPAAFGLQVDSTQVIRADLLTEGEDPEELQDLVKQIEAQGDFRVWADPTIAQFPSAIDCTPSTPTGNAGDVADALRAPAVWSQIGSRGHGIAIGIVDGGVDGSLFPVIGGWSPDPAAPPGFSSVAWGGHGNMCAFDARIAAPDARVLDYAIGRATGVPALISAALQAFQHALGQFTEEGIPQVLSNSWGLYRQSWDPFAPGHPSNYSHNPAHPFNRKVAEVMDAGILVSFAAGNCGVTCPDGRCGADIGPGRSIRGANGLQRVLCVGAVNLRDERIGYSSQGPSTLAADKPDVCGFSHFLGQTPCDNGTSAACPVVAGVLGLLKSAYPGVSQDRMRGVVHSSARRTSHGGWSTDFGYGIIDAKAALIALP